MKFFLLENYIYNTQSHSRFSKVGLNYYIRFWTLDGQFELTSAFRMLGEPVVSIGFPFSSSIRPTISSGVVSKSMDCALLTTCCVQSGTSGGPIINHTTGDMLGMVVCNVLSSDGTTLYPRMSLAVPATILSGPLREYLRTDSQ